MVQDSAKRTITKWRNLLKQHVVKELTKINDNIVDPKRMDNVTTNICRKLTKLFQIVKDKVVNKKVKAKCVYSNIEAFSKPFAVMCLF